MNDTDKLFEFMTKIYSEMQDGFRELKAEVKDHTQRFNTLETKLEIIETDIKKMGAKIDSELIPTSIATLDGYKANHEHITIINDKIDKLQIDVNNISMAVSHNDIKIIKLSKDFKKAK